MIAFSQEEAILFRILVGFFGKDRVIPHMSVLAVCGGVLPKVATDFLVSRDNNGNGSHDLKSKKGLTSWAKSVKCLFTVVNQEDAPRLVVEFTADFGSVVDIYALENQHIARSLLKSLNIPYITMNQRDFADITNPQHPIDVFHYLQDKLDLELTDEQDEENYERQRER